MILNLMPLLFRDPELVWSGLLRLCGCDQERDITEDITQMHPRLTFQASRIHRWRNFQHLLKITIALKTI